MEYIDDEYYILCSNCKAELYEDEEYIEYEGEDLCIDCAVKKFVRDNTAYVKKLTKADIEWELADIAWADRCLNSDYWDEIWHED